MQCKLLRLKWYKTIIQHYRYIISNNTNYITFTVTQKIKKTHTHINNNDKQPGRVQCHAWHIAINDLIHRVQMQAEMPAVKELQGLSRDDGKRPDGLTLVPWQSRCRATWDVTVAHTLATSYAFQNVLQAGSAAAAASARKTTKYSTLSPTHVFTALYGMQTRSSNENYDRLSNCQMRALWQNGRKLCLNCYTIQKSIYPSFLRSRMVGGRRPFYLKFWVNRPALEQNRRFWTDNSS